MQHPGLVDKFPLGTLMNRSLTIKTAAKGYDIFLKKDDNCEKVVLTT